MKFFKHYSILRLLYAVFFFVHVTDLYSAATSVRGRNISVLAYTDIVRTPEGMPVLGFLQKTDFSLPIGISGDIKRPSFQEPFEIVQAGQLSLTIDPDAMPEVTYFTRSTYTSLPAARDDLAKREGNSDRNTIAYVRRLQPGQEAELNEEYRSDVNSAWVGRLLQLPREYADTIIDWAERTGFDAVIWPSSPVHVLTESELIEESIRESLAFQAHAASSSDAGGLASSSDVFRAPDIIDTTYMYAHRGNIPVLITAPHGGRVEIPGVAKRTARGACFAWDHNSDLLARAISKELKNILGVEPYVVIAKFHRDQIDGNRSPNDAYEDRRAKPVYDAFQAQIAHYLDEMKQRYGDTLIHFDIHGQAVERKTIYRGTRNRSTVQPLLRRYGEEAFTGPHSALGALEQRGYTIFPSSAEPARREYGPFTGGYIVGHYSKTFGIPSIQLETGGWHRDENNIPQVAKDMAAAIADFLIHYNYLR